MYFIYILYSEVADKYYVGCTDDPYRRLEEHNSKPYDTFTSKYRPWKLRAYFMCGTNHGVAIQLERYIKKQKSRKLIEQLCNPTFMPFGELAQLVRVPDVRD